MRMLVFRGGSRVALALTGLWLVGCNEAKDATKADTPAAPAGGEPDASSPAHPEPAPAPAPEGAVTIANPPLFVQTCDEQHACPELVQAEGEKHCAALVLGAAQAWRLPTRDEVERLRGVQGLAQLAGYHWTSSAFDQDDTQVWIVDPTSDQPTTVPRDRKPFRIRCVREP